jgi:hypothetical protein
MAHRDWAAARRPLQLQLVMNGVQAGAGRDKALLPPGSALTRGDLIAGNMFVDLCLSAFMNGNVAAGPQTDAKVRQRTSILLRRRANESIRR